MRPLFASTLKSLRDFAHNERGTTAIEYALIAGCISIAIVTVTMGIGTQLNNLFTTVKDSYPS